MLINEFPIYICSKIEELNIDITDSKKVANHRTGKLEKRNVIIPTHINSETINPKNFIELKNKLGIDKILFIDRIKGTDKSISISDHVNRSGQNFLRRNTPEGDLPQFPDMSKIYNVVEGFESFTVHTLGHERFEKLQDDKKNIYSEFVGLIAPVAHYVGIKVSALGSKSINDIITKL